LKRAEAVPDARPVRFDDLVLDPARRSVERSGQRLEVSDLSFDLLAALAAAWPAPLDTAAMARTVWNSEHVSEETAAQRIALLRKALGDEARQPRYIRTVRHRGYALIPQPIAIDAHPAAARWLRPALLAGLAGAAAAVLWIAVSHPRPASEPTSTAPPRSTADVASETRIERARALLQLQQPAETDRAIALLEAVLADRPDHDRARLTLSFALTTRVTKFAPDDHAMAARGEALARQLVDDDDRNGDAWHALAYALDARGLIDEALAAYRQAYTLNPQDVPARSSAAYLLRVRGQLAEALTLEVQALDRGAPTLYGPVQIASSLDLMGLDATRWWQAALVGGAGESVTLAERVEADFRAGDAAAALARIDMASTSVRATPRIRRLAGLAHLRLGHRDAARAAFRAAGAAADVERATLAAMQHETVDVAPFTARIDQAVRDGETWPDLRIRIAGLLAQTGDLDGAAALVGTALDLGWRDHGQLDSDPFLAPLRATEAWPPLMARLDREIAAQRRLVETDPALSGLLAAE
jgi:DNA-binding winged helix-turn-helix (wHTH) protein/Flp pilus assembly protein TadD